MSGQKAEQSASTGRENLQLSFINFSEEAQIKEYVLSLPQCGSPKRQQLARTTAIKNSLQIKRRKLQLTNENFIDETHNIGRRQKKRSTDDAAELSKLPPLRTPITVAPIDVLPTGSGDSARLAALLQHSSARQAGDPVFSINSDIEFQGLHSVFNGGLEDPGLASAVCLALSFAANGGILTDECGSLRLRTIQHVNEKLSDPSRAASPSTVGAVLLLVGVEARLGERDITQMHLNGTRQLVRLCNERSVYLNHALKRALFWQDLFSAMIADTTRVFSLDIFPELQWQRNPLQSVLYTVPIGFAKRADALGSEFIEIIGDICALQHLHDTMLGKSPDNLQIEKVDSQQAWIESRLEQLRHQTKDPLLLCCIPVAYLCAYGFFTAIWSGPLVPSRVTAMLLRHLQNSESFEDWDEHADLLLWLLNIGASFAIDDSVRLGFAGLWHGSHRSRLEPLSRSWNDVERYLKSFIWSEQVHGPGCGEFWQRLQEL